jgi:hypothetical protein
MALIAETLGMMLRDTASIPAAYADILRGSAQTWALATSVAIKESPH